MTNQEKVHAKYPEAHYVHSGHRSFIRAYREGVPFTLIETHVTEDTWKLAAALVEGADPKSEPETLPANPAEAAYEQRS